MWLLDFLSNLFLMDNEISPINGPMLVFIKRPTMHPEKVLEQMIHTQMKHPNCPCNRRLVKMYGRYFFREMTHDEFQEWKKCNSGIIYDQLSEEDVIEYGLRMKATNNLAEEYSNVKNVYFPKVGKDQACFIILGHHTMMDGISFLKGIYLMTDQVTERKDFYPFTAFLRTYTTW